MAAAAFVVFTARASLADHYRVPSGSMEPTVHVGDRIIVAKLAYGVRIPLTNTWLVRFGLPTRGDVVVLDPPADGADEEAPGARGDVAAVLLKRVVGLPGETISVRDGHVFIDDRPIAEPWASVALGGGRDFGPRRVPEGKLLVLGDNRGNSRDGRSFGFVDVDSVLGRATFVVARDGKPSMQTL